MWNKLGVLLVALVLSMGVSYGKKIGSQEFLLFSNLFTDGGVNGNGTECLRILQNAFGGGTCASATAEIVFFNSTSRPLEITRWGVHVIADLNATDADCTLRLQTAPATDLDHTSATFTTQSSIEIGDGSTADVAGDDVENILSGVSLDANGGMARIQIVTDGAETCTNVQSLDFHVYGKIN